MELQQFYCILELRRRKNVVLHPPNWHSPNMARRSSSRNSEPSFISNFGNPARRPSMPFAFRSHSLRIGQHEWPISGLDPPPSTIPRRRGSLIIRPLDRTVYGK